MCEISDNCTIFTRLLITHFKTPRILFTKMENICVNIVSAKIEFSDLGVSIGSGSIIWRLNLLSIKIQSWTFLSTALILYIKTKLWRIQNRIRCLFTVGSGSVFSLSLDPDPQTSFFYNTFFSCLRRKTKVDKDQNPGNLDRKSGN